MDPVGATLDAVESLDDGVGDSQALSEAISDYSSEVSERLDESDGRDDPVVKETLNSHVSELKQTSAEETSGGEIDTQLEFENDKYLRWHARLKQLRGVEDDSTPLEELYRKHLDEIAEEQGWE